MVNILAFETSIGNCSVALSCNGKITYSESSQKMMQSEQLIPMINDILSRNSITYKELSAVACSIGPGSFTGIRVGVAAALGIKKAQPHIKLIGISTLDALSNGSSLDGLKASEKILVILRSYGEEFYAQEFKYNQVSPAEIIVLSQQELEIHKKNYNLIISNEELENCKMINLNARSIMDISINKYGSTASNASIEPIYVKKPNIHGHN
jgi:tRNA threonylcarbamoyl adenosine modification protein YeaZ